MNRTQPTRELETVKCLFWVLLWFLVSATDCSTEPTVDRTQLRAQITLARQEGRFADALRDCHTLLADYKDEPEEYRWHIDTWERNARTLETILSLSKKGRAEMAGVYRLEPEITQLLRVGKFVDCDETFCQMIDIRTRHLGPTHPDVARTHANRARFLAQCGRAAEAESLLLLSISLSEMTLGPEHPTIAKRLSALGAVYEDQERYTEAEKAHLRACSLFEQTKNREHRDFAKALNNLAVLYAQRGNLAAADPLYRESIAINRRLSRAPNLEFATQLHNVANLFLSRGNPREAEPLFREALDMKLELFPEHGERVTNSMKDLAEALLLLNRLAEAEDMCRRTLRIQFGTTDDDYPRPGNEQAELIPPDISRTLRLLVHIQLQQGNVNAAARTCALALEWAQNFLGGEHSDVARIRMDMGAISMRQGALDEAEQQLLQALEVLPSRTGVQHPDAVLARQYFAQCLFLQNDVDAAERELTLAAEGFEMARLRVGHGLERATFQQSPYRLLAILRLRQGQPIQAWEATERSRARALEDLLALTHQRPLPESDKRHYAALMDSVHRLQESHDVLAERHTHLQTTQSARAVIDARTQWWAAEAALSTYERELAVRYPVPTNLSTTLGEIQATLSARTALIGCLHSELPDSTMEDWVYVIRRGCPIHWIPLSQSEGGNADRDLLSEARDFRRVLRRSAQQEVRGQSDWSIKAQARCLWELAFKPIEPYLDGIDHLIVIPAEPLLGIPIGCLVDDTGRYICDRFLCSYVPSASILQLLPQGTNAQRKPTERKALLIGDPVFTQTPRKGDESRSPANEIMSLLRGEYAGSKALPSLHGTRDEIRKIADLFTLEPTILLGANASEEKVMSCLGKGKGRIFDTILIATHTILDSQHGDQSSMVFSQVNLRDPLDAMRLGEPLYDGCISAREIIRRFELEADLVVLSSCQTALGEYIEGEGYVGLSYAFMLAGARNLLVSLWKVDDRATAALMQRFFENLMNQDCHAPSPLQSQPVSQYEALQEAKQWLRTQEDSRGYTYTHPIYWSGFVLIGGVK